MLLLISDTFGVCGLSEETPSQVAGWWGDEGVEIKDSKECKDKDHHPGLTFIKYKNPANKSQPDHVRFFLDLAVLNIVYTFNVCIS